MSVSSAEFVISTTQRNQLLDITERVQQAVRDAHVQDGVVMVFVPHTTAAVTINENADPDVARDVLATLAALVPQQARYRHAEGNADAHIKTILTGSSVTVFVAGGELRLGQWQGIFLCEFDGPRRRSVWLKIAAD